MQVPAWMRREMRQFRCPGCYGTIAVPQHKPDPLLCPGCAKTEKRREIRDRLTAPFRSAGRKVKWLVIELVACVVLYYLVVFAIKFL